jgi:hypothetical protein
MTEDAPVHLLLVPHFKLPRTRAYFCVGGNWRSGDIQMKYHEVFNAVAMNYP